MAEATNWKRVTRSLVSPLTLLVLLAILFFGARWGYRNVTAPPLPPPIISCSPSPVGKVLKSSQVTVNIYNGGRQHGLAGKVAKQLKSRGFIVQHVDNTEEKVETTVIIGNSKDDPAVKLVAQQFVKPEIREDGKPDGIVDVLVGNKFAGTSPAKKPFEVAVSEDPCLPPPSASPSEA